MPSFWKDLLNFLLPSTQITEENKEGDKKTIKTPDTRETYHSSWRFDYPKTYRVFNDVAEPETPRIFDPALSQYPRAFRHGNPSFETEEIRYKWHETRNQVIDYLLGIISNSRWNDNLVLRGSLLLKAWLGDEAREPGDIDWVFCPADVGIDSSLSSELFEDLVKRVSANPIIGEASIDISRTATDDIWTYERAAGRRIIFPWKAEGIPPGAVQMDIVFGEKLWLNPVQTVIPTYDNHTQLLWSADKELSLAWKLLWLETDFSPQGKDLYDATLLAEQTPLSIELLTQVLSAGDWNNNTELKANFALQWQIDWDNFKLEYPWVEGTAQDWQQRLYKALAPNFKR